jgi:hypothetical protein
LLLPRGVNRMGRKLGVVGMRRHVGRTIAHALEG